MFEKVAREPRLTHTCKKWRTAQDQPTVGRALAFCEQAGKVMVAAHLYTKVPGYGQHVIKFD